MSERQEHSRNLIRMTGPYQLRNPFILWTHEILMAQDSHGTAPVVVSFDSDGELVRRQSGSSTLREWISAPLPRQIGVSRHLCHCSDGWRCSRLRFQSWAVYTANVDRPPPIIPYQLRR